MKALSKSTKQERPKPWLNQALATLERWADAQEEVRFILDLPGCSISHRGKIAGIAGKRSFLSRSGMHVGLSPAAWNSVRVEDGVAVHVNFPSRQGGITITREGADRRDISEEIDRVCTQFQTWIKLGLDLALIVSYGVYVKIDSCLLKSLPPPSTFALEGKAGEHIIVLDKCRHLVFERRSEFSIITVYGEPGEPTVQISDRYQEPEDALLRFSSGTAMVH